jgi:hypothetical protein
MMRFLRMLAVVPLLSSLSACLMAPLGGPASTQLAFGGVSAMDADATQLRNELTINPTPIYTPLRYAPVAECRYAVEEISLAGPLPDRDMTLSLRPVRDRLLATFASSGLTSTALISVNGRIHDFNGRVFSGAGSNSDNFGQVADTMRRSNAQINAVLNDFSIFLPEFSAAPYSPGSIASVVRSDRGEIWATYVYRGMVDIKGRPGALLDIIRGDGSNAGQPTIGFSIVDRQRGIPLLMTFQAGSLVRVNLRSCGA